MGRTQPSTSGALHELFSVHFRDQEEHASLCPVYQRLQSIADSAWSGIQDTEFKAESLGPDDVHRHTHSFQTQLFIRIKFQKDSLRPNVYLMG